MWWSDGPFGGGFFVLASGASGLTYLGEPVGSVEFRGCLPQDYPGTSVVQIIDDTGSADGLSYTIVPALDELPQSEADREAGKPVQYQSSCEGGVPVPPTQSNSDALALAGTTNLYQHYLSYDCDWEVTFAGVPQCHDSITVWAEGEAGLEFAEAVTETHERGQLKLRLWQRNRSDSSSGDNAAAPLGGFGYYVGSGGGRQLAADATGVPAGNVSDDLSFVPLAALSLECASEVEFASVSGLEGPGLELSVTSPGTAGVGSTVSVCTADQDRLPGVEVLEPSLAAFTLPLNRSCGWNITFKSQATACLAAARVFDTSSPPVALGGVLRTAQDEAATIALTPSETGVQYRPTGGTATAVGAIEFYDCFYPSVSLSNPAVLAGTEFTTTFEAVGAKAGCTATATQTVLAGNPSLTFAQRIAAVQAGLAVTTQVKAGRALLNGLATDGSLCEYDVSVTGPVELGRLTPERISARHSFVTVEQATIALTLRNATSASSSGLAAPRQSVTVTLTPQPGCEQNPPAGSPYVLTAAGTAGASAPVKLAAPACVWTVSYRTANSDCLVSAQFQDADGSAVGEANTSGSLEITSRVGVSRATQVAAIEFTVLSCYSTFEANLAVSVADATIEADHTGTVIEAVVAPTESSPDGCSSQRTVRLVLGSGTAATSETASASAILAAVPEGQSGGQSSASAPASCAYEVGFADPVVTADGVLLTRISPAADATASLSAASASAAARYSASYPAAVTLANATTFATAHQPASQRDIVVTVEPVASATCTESAPAASPYTIYALLEATAVLGDQVCAWTISYANTAADCQVSAQLKDAAGANIGSADTDGELTIYATANRQARSAASGGTRIDTIEFTVGASCTSYFDASITVSVTGASDGDHDGDQYTVTVAPVDTAPTSCTASQEANLVLGTSNTATVDVDNLVDTNPVEGGACSYTVTFPEFHHSYATSTVQRRSTAATATISAASSSATASYAASTLFRVNIIGNYSSYPTELGFTWTMTPSNCDDPPGDNTLPVQTEAHAVLGPRSSNAPEMHNYLDYRCNWTVATTYHGLCTAAVVLLRPRGQDHIRATSFILSKKPANKGFVYNSGSERVFEGFSLQRSREPGIGDCFNNAPNKELVIAAKDGSALSSLEGQNVTYRLTGISRAQRDSARCSGLSYSRPAMAEADNSYKHKLEFRCDYEVRFSAPPVANKCFVVDIAYETADGTRTTTHATRGGFVKLLSDYSYNDRPFYGRLALGDYDSTQEVNRLLVSYIDEVDGNGVRQCASNVNLENIAGGQYELNVSVAAELPRAKQTDPAGQACAPNALSDTLANINARVAVLHQRFQDLYVEGLLNEELLSLGHNCDWLITFGSANPNCAAEATFWNENTQLTRKRPLFTMVNGEAVANTHHVEPYVVATRPGETATVRLQGTAEGIKVRVGDHVDGPGADMAADLVTVTEVEINSCATPAGTADIMLTDRSPADVDVSYEFVPVACHGVTAKTRTQADEVELHRIFPTYVRADGSTPASRSFITKDGQYQQLNFFCDWEVSFAASNGCPVTVRMVYLDLPDWNGADAEPDGLVNGADIVTNSFKLHAPIDDDSNEVHRNYLLYNNDSFKNVIELQYSVATEAADCARLNEYTNTSASADFGAISIKVVPIAQCQPKTGFPGGSFVLGARETITILQDRDCDWGISYSSALGPTYDKLCRVSTGSDTSNDAMYRYTFNGCRDGSSAFHVAEVTIIQDVGPYDFVQYSVQVNYCDQGVTNPPDQTQADAVSVTGRQRVHYLDYRCSWAIVFNNPFNGCVVIATTEDAAETEFTRDTDGSISIYDDTDNQRFVAGTSAPGNTQEVKVVRGVVLLDEIICHPKVVFENRSRPFPFSVGDLADIQGDLPNPRGTRENPLLDTLTTFEHPFPRMVLQIKPVTSPGNACTRADVPGPQTVLDAMTVKTVTYSTGTPVRTITGKPELAADGSFMFTVDHDERQLDKTCDWRVEFVSEVTGGDRDCFAAARVLGGAGELLGTVGAGAYDGELQTPRNDQGAEDPAGTDLGPFGGGTLILQTGTHGLTYQGSVVGTIEFQGCVGWESSPELDDCIRVVNTAEEYLGCLERDYPGQAEFHIRDATDPVGDIRYTIAPAVKAGLVQCEGLGSEPPPAQTQADGVVFAEAPGSYAHFLDTRCEWEVTVERQATCEALGIWGARPNSGPDSDDGHLVYLGSVADGELSLGLSPEVDHSPGGGPSMAAADDPATPLVGLTLECVSTVELRSMSGAAGPGLDVTVQPVARAQVGGQPPAYDPSVVCERHQRYPLVTGADDLPTDDRLLPRETIDVVLNRSCSWEVQFKSRHNSCMPTAIVLSEAGRRLGGEVRATAGSPATLTLVAGAAGITYPAVPGEGETAGVVGSIRFYDCFTPQVSLATIPGLQAGDEFTVRFWSVGELEGCTTGASQVVVAGDPTLTNEARVKAAISGNPQDTRVQGEPALLEGWGDDELYLCSYEVEVAGPARLGTVGYLGRVVTVPGYEFVPLSLLHDRTVTLRNATASTTSHSPASQRSVVVTMTRSGSACERAAPAGSFTLGQADSATDSRVVLLGVEDCVWTVRYQNPDDDCLATVELQDAAGAAISSFTDVNDREFDLTVRGRESGSTPVAAAEFTVGDCFESFEATLSASATDAAGPLAEHAGTRIELTATPVAGSNEICYTGPLVLELAEDGTAELTRNLPDTPVGGSVNCVYDVAVPEVVVTPAGELRRTSASTFRLSEAAASGTAVVFEAKRPVSVALVNASAASVLPRQRGVVVSVEPAAECDDRVLGASSYSLAAGAAAPVPGVLGLADCEWVIGYGNTAGDCLVDAQFKDANGAAVGGVLRGADELSVFVVGEQVRSAASDGMAVATVEFAVSATCTTFFSGALAVSVTDAALEQGAGGAQGTAALAAHAGTELVVSVVQSGEDRPECTAVVAAVTLRLDAAGTASGLVRDLVARPLGGAACEYAATFPATAVTDAGVTLVRQGAAVMELSASAPRVARTYEVYQELPAEVFRGPQLVVRNATQTSSSHAAASERTVEVTLETPMSCAAGAQSHSLELLAGAQATQALGAEECTWTIEVQNPADNCAVSVQFKDANGGTLGTAADDGEATVYVIAGQLSHTATLAPVPALPVATAELTVSDTGCRVDFEATIAASVTDTASGDHSGTAVAVDLTPTGSSHADCTAIQTVTLTLGPPAQSSSAANEAAETVTLIHQPQGETATCAYTAMFPATANTAANVTLNLTTTPNPVALSQSAATATGAYTAAYSTSSTTNTLTIGNSGDHDSTPAELGVSYTLAPVPNSCDSGVDQPSTQHNGNAADVPNNATGRVTHQLDYRCSWTMTFAHTGGCKVTAAVNNSSSPLAGAASVASPLTLAKPSDTSSANPFTYSGSAANGLDITVDKQLELCLAELVVRAADGTSTLEPLPTQEQGITRQVSYNLRPSNCFNPQNGQVVAPTNSILGLLAQDRDDATVVDTVNYQHRLEYRCDWNVEFSYFAHQNCLHVELAYEDEAGEVTVHALQDEQLTLTKDQDNSRFVYGSPADGLVVNRLLVGFVEEIDADGNRACTSTLVFEQASTPPAGVQVSVAAVRPGSPGVPVEPGGSQAACKPGFGSSTAAEVNAELASFTTNKSFRLDSNCDWLVTFGSTDESCSVVAKLKPFGSPTVAWEAKAGQTATIRLYGGEFRFRTGVPHKGELLYLRTDALQLDSCGTADHQTPVELTKSGSLTVEYEFKPVNCRGRSAEAQTQDDAVTIGTKTFHYLDWACDWQVSFTAQANCEVTIDVYDTGGTKLTPQAIGSLELVGQVAPGAFSTLNHRHLRYDTTPTMPNASWENVGKLDYSAVTGTDNAKCSDEVELRNMAAAGRNTPVEVTFAPVDDVDATPPLTACTPNTRGAAPDKLVLAGGESVMVALALDCEWQVKFKPVNAKNCAASAQVKDVKSSPSDTEADIGAAVTTTLGSTDAGVVALSKSSSGLTAKHTDNSALVVGSIVFDGCVEATADTVPTGTVAVTMVDETGTLALSYDLEVDSGTCESGVTEPGFQVLSTAVVLGASRVHYLNYSCNWLVTASDRRNGGCAIDVEFKQTAAAGATVHNTTANIGQESDNTKRLLTKDPDDMQLVFGAAADDKTVGALVFKPGAGCVLPVRLVNVSTPLGYHFSRTGPDAEWNFLPGLRPSPGMASTNQDNVVEFDRQFPEVTLDILPHTAGATCTPDEGYEPALDNDVVLPAGRIDLGDDGAKLNFYSGSRQLGLDPDCDWRIGFLSGIGVDVEFLTGQPDPVCYASAQVRDRDGMALGSPIAGAPDLGGYVDLETGSDGLTYTPSGGTATLVGSIDFEGCVPLEHPGASEVMIYDDSGTAGDFTYTLTPAQRPKPQTAAEIEAGAAVEMVTTCEGFAPPDAQTQADGLVFSGAPGARLHLLNNSCDWVVEFSGVSECEASMLWQFGETGLRFVDAVWGTPEQPGTPGSAKVTLRLTQYHGDQLDHTQLGRSPPGLPEDDPTTADVDERKLAREDRDTAAALESGLGFFVGSGSDMTEGGVRHTNEVRPAMLPTGVGAASISDLEGAQPVNAVSLECVSAVDFISAASGPGLEIVTASPAKAAPDPSMDQVITPGGCVTHELRPSVAGLETVSMPLLQGCDWTVTFKSSAPTCLAAAEVLGADKTTLLQRVFQTSAAAVEIELAKDAGGLQFTPSGAGATASVVGAIKFYDCFHPNVTLRVPTAVAGEQVTISFMSVAGQTGCTTLASQTMTLGSPTPVTLTDGTTVAQYEASINRLTGAPTALVSLAANGTPCQYSVTATSANSLLGELSSATAVTYQASAVVVRRFEQAALTLRNATSASSSGHTSAAQRTVLVTVAPKAQACSVPAPAGSPFALGAAGSVSDSRSVSLPASCVWTVSYQNSAGDCTVEARLRDADGELVSGTSVDDDGSLEITTRGRAADSTPVAELEFTVASCGAVFDLVNLTQTTSGHSPFIRRSLRVELKPSTSCGVSATERDPLVLPADSTLPVTLDIEVCEWTLSYGNTHGDCKVSAQLLEADGTSISTDEDGELSVFVDANRQVVSAASSGTVIDRVELTVLTDCSSVFSGSVTILVTDSNQAASHVGTVFVIGIAPATGSPAGCSTNLADEELELTSGSSVSESLTGLADEPYSDSSHNCIYTVTFRNPTVASVGTPGVTLVLVGEATDTLSASRDRLRPSYRAAREATLLFENGTAAASAGHSAAQRTVVAEVNPVTTQTCTDSAPAQKSHDLTPQASVRALLGESACEWKVSYRNMSRDCRVTALLKSPTDSTISTDTDGEVSVWVDANRDVRATSSGGAQVSRIDFEVGAAATHCTTTFPATISVSVTDSNQNADHQGREVEVTLAPVALSDNGCTAQRNYTLTIGTTGDASQLVTLVGSVLGQTACVYEVTFPATATAVANTVELRRASTSPEKARLSASTTERTAAATYEAQQVADTDGPAVDTVAVSPTSITVGATATVSIELSEAPAAGTFDASDVLVTPAGVVTKGTLTGSGTSYSLALTAVGAGSVTITVEADKFTDAAGNNNTAATDMPTLTVNAAGTPQTDTPVITAPTANALVGKSFRVSGTAEPTAAIAVQLGGVALTPAVPVVAGSDRSWSGDFTLTEGQFTTTAAQTLSVTATVSGETTSAPATRSLRVDAVSPRVTSVSLNTNSIVVGATATVRIELSEAPAAGTFDASDVLVTETPAAGVTQVVSKGTLTGSGTSYSLALTAVGAGSVTITVEASKFTDAAGNNNLAAATPAALTVTTATTPQTDMPVITAPTANALVGKSFRVSGTAEPMAAIAVRLGSVTLTPAVPVVAGSDRSWSGDFTLTEGQFTTTAAQTLSVTATVSGETTSVPATRSLRVDAVSPKVTSVSVSPASVTVGGTATVSIELSEAPAAGTFTAADISVAPSGIVTKAALLSGSGTSYSLALAAVGAGSVMVTVEADKFTDAAGNNNLAAATPAALTVNVAGAPQTDTPVITAPAANALVGKSFRVSGTAEPTAAIAVRLGAVTLVPAVPIVAGSDRSWSGDFTLTEGQFTTTAAQTLSVTATVSGETTSAPATRSLRVDAVSPRVTAVSVSPTSINIGSTATVRITLSEAPATGTFTAADVSVALAGVVSKGSLTGSGTSYSLVLTGTATGSVTVTVASGSFTDAAGNPNTVTASPATLAVTAAPGTPTPQPSVPPPTPGVSVSPAGSVTEGETLRFGVSLPGRAVQQVVVSYTVAGGTAAESTTGNVMIEAGQSSAVIEVPTEDDDLDEADQTVRVALTGATGGVAVASLGRTATGVVRDDDPSPLVGLGRVVIDGNRLRFKVELSVRSGRDVKASYMSPAGSGTAVISAGELDTETTQLFDRELLASGGSLTLRLTSAQNASIDPNARERVVMPGGSWQFHQVSRDGGVRASQLAQALELGGSWRLFSWNATSQRWVEHSPTSNSNATLPTGVTITYRGPEHSQTTLAAAGLGRPATITLAQGWNIFTPDPAAAGLTLDDFTRTRDGVSAVVFDPRLIDCDQLAGLLVIYTFDQNDPRSQNGFRLTLPCHPELQDQLGIPAIETIDRNDTIYAWFNSTTPVQITFQEGQYTPTG